MNKWKAAMFSCGATVLVFITMSDVFRAHLPFGMMDGMNLVFAAYFIGRIAFDDEDQ